MMLRLEEAVPSAAQPREERADGHPHPPRTARPHPCVFEIESGKGAEAPILLRDECNRLTDYCCD